MQVNDWDLTFFRDSTVFPTDLKHFRPSVPIQVIQANLNFKNVLNQEVSFYGKIGQSSPSRIPDYTPHKSPISPKILWEFAS